MKPELEIQSQFEPASNDSKLNNTSDELDHCYIPRARPSEANGFAVYTRSKRLKSKIRAKIGEANADSAEGSSGVSGEMMEVEVKEEDLIMTTTRRSNGGRRFTRSVIRSNDDDEDVTGLKLNEVELDKRNLTELVDAKSPKNREMKMSKKVLLRGRPTTVRELFETGLLEGYPVFYNGGKRVCFDFCSVMFY